MQFNDRQLRAIDRALSIAAEVYEADAKATWEQSPRISEQLTRQAQEARAIASLIIA